ncbi:MAG TPA: GntR family transcriptional regulator, partial [Erythrobacter sp.]|nr:GntR family transcriptional regulator [Erythrobacter sp.]
VRKVPFTRGEVELSAISAEARTAQMLSIGRGEALFTMRRTTWLGERSVTTMALHYTPGYRLDFTI